ncbi:sulfatase [Salinirubrum litoreum]|uniref:Sulfatase n=1 Tax=Salinirubrum litoreum TaxID=1126234 RepID=A0ABD5R8I0_9EURY|nr:sulfatase [Salinirubrum litoreum]
MHAEAVPNVLLVVLDSVRASNCSVYGAPRETTPFLESFTDEAVTYTQARAPSNWSLPSHVSLFTGLEAHEHRVTVHDRLIPGHTAFESLETAGYDTGLFSENGFLTGHEVGIENCFETVVAVPDSFDDAYDTGEINPGPDGFYYADQLLDWTAGRDEPWAACLNLMDAHRPFEPRDEYDQWADERARELQQSLDTRWEWTFHGGDRPYWQLSGLESLYDGGIRQADAVVESVVEGLRRRGDLDETLVVVCGDHGDGFGEPGYVAGEPPAVSHIVPMHEELLHVPLLVRPPGGGTGDRCHRPAALTQFPAVVREHLDGEPSAHGFATERVVSMKQPVTADLRDRFERACDDLDSYTAASRAVYTDAPGTAVRKRYYWGEQGLEALVHGPGDVQPQGSVEPATVDGAFERGEEGVREPLDGRQVTDEAKEQLAALGYY